AGGDARRVRDPHDERAGPPHLLLEEPDRRLERRVAKRVRAHELRELVAGVRLGAAHRPHLVEVDVDAVTRELPGGLAAREPAADDRYPLGHALTRARRSNAGGPPRPATSSTAGGVARSAPRRGPPAAARSRRR